MKLKGETHRANKHGRSSSHDHPFPSDVLSPEERDETPDGTSYVLQATSSISACIGGERCTEYAHISRPAGRSDSMTITHYTEHVKLGRTIVPCVVGSGEPKSLPN